MQQDRVIDKVKKLLRLSTSDNVNEAAAAAARAQSLMDEHRIDQAMIDVSDTGDDEPAEADEKVSDHDHEPVEVGRAIATWKGQLLMAVCGVNACKCYRGYQPHDGRYVRNLCIIGRPSDVAMVRHLYAYLAHEIERLCRKENRSYGRTWMNSFRLGAVSEVSRRLRLTAKSAQDEKRKALAGNTKALAVLDRALVRIEKRTTDVEKWAKEHMNLRSRSSGRSNRDWSGYEAGKEAGRSINLSPAQRRALGGGK